MRKILAVNYTTSNIASLSHVYIHADTIRIDMTKMLIYPTDYRLLIESWPEFNLKNLKVDKSA